MSQSVTHFSSLLHTDRISQIEATWDYTESYGVGGRNTLLSPSLGRVQLVRPPFQIFLKYFLARGSTGFRHRHPLSFRLPQSRPLLPLPSRLLNRRSLPPHPLRLLPEALLLTGVPSLGVSPVVL
jgi:hypothetical protein